MEKSPALPVWIYKRDGRLVPFEGDKISQSLFAACETLGRPDAFTARELTDSVLHFLSADLNGAIPRTGQVADMVIKVVRELGQTAIALAYAEFFRHRDQSTPTAKKQKPVRDLEKVGREAWPELPGPEALVSVDPHALVRSAAARRLEDYSLREIFTRDIAAAHKDGLIMLTGLEAPFELQGGLLPRIEPGRFAFALDEIRASVGQFIALDGPDFAEIGSASQALGSPSVAEWGQELQIWLRATGLFAVVNLNSTTPPPWAQSLAAGPLFHPGLGISSLNDQAAQADEMLALFCSLNNEWTQVHWHLCESDWQSKNELRMARLARYILQGAPITIAFDRANRPISLAEGLDRKYSNLLITVGLHLPNLSRQLGDRAETALFIQKLGSLARLAITAAVQKRRFLTRYHRPRAAFLVDRARLTVVPVGLESVAQKYTGQSIRPGTPGLEFASRIIHNLSDILNQEGPRYNLEISLDSAPTLAAIPVLGRSSVLDLNSGHRSSTEGDASPVNPLGAKSKDANFLLNLEQLAGLTVWNDSLSPREQIQAAASLHAITGTGTAWVQLPPGASPTEEEVIALLRFAWKDTPVSRVRFLKPHAEGQQLTAFWEALEERHIGIS